MTNETTTETGATSSAEAAPKNEKLKWYVVHTYSGFENRAKKSLEERIKQQNLDAYFGEILIPTEQVTEAREVADRALIPLGQRAGAALHAQRLQQAAPRDPLLAAG